MFWSYVKTIFRNIAGSKVYFFINVAGLAIGFTVFTLIMLYVLNEFNYDTFNKKANRIYRVVEIQEPPGAAAQQVAFTMPALGPALRGQFPGVDDAVRYVRWFTVLCHHGEKRFYEDGLSFADSNIFKIFTFHFLEGNPNTALNGPDRIVVDQATARKYFGDADPIGKSINIEVGLHQNSFQVTGVIKDFPLNSHLHFNMIASFVTLEKRWDYFNGWTNNDVVTYVLLNKRGGARDLGKRIADLIRKNLPQAAQVRLQIHLQSLKRIHLYSTNILYQVNFRKGNVENVRLFLLIALFVIALACINFVNLTTARSTVRTRQVGIRKLLGSHHSHLVYQFIGESVVLSLAGLLLSFPIVEALLPKFDSMMSGSIITQYSNQLAFILVMVLAAVIIGVVAGLYPALYLSSFRPIELLRSRFSSSRRGITLRKALTVLQFSIAIGLVTGTGVVVSQMDFIYNRPLGFNKEDLIYIPLRDAQSRKQIQLIRDRLLGNSGVVAVSAGERTGGGSLQGVVIIPGGNSRSKLMVRESYVDYGYTHAMGMEMAEGRDFSRDSHVDSSSVIINAAMVRTLGWKDPIGKQIQLGNGERFTVIGVLRNFNYSSLRTKVDPLVMWFDPAKCQYLLVRISSHERESEVNFVKSVWNSTFPNQPFEYGFVDNYLDRMYGNDKQNENLLMLFSLVAVVVACLGLFGLTLHTTEQRVKEIGVRKVLGASIFKIVFMLSQESIKLLIAACIVSWPVAYFLMDNWLHNFEYRISLSIWIFAVSGFIVFFTAVLTLSFLAIKAGLANPADALRYE